MLEKKRMDYAGGPWYEREGPGKSQVIKSFIEKKEEYIPNGDDFCFRRALEMVLPEKCYGSWRSWTCFGEQIMAEWSPKIITQYEIFMSSRKKIAAAFTPIVLAYLYRPGDGPLYLKYKNSFEYNVGKSGELQISKI